MDTKKHICSRCIDEEYFRKNIDSNGEIKRCSFCNKKRKTLDFELIIENILDGIEYIYDDPANGLGFVDGEYVKGNGDITDTFDLLTDEFGFGGSIAFQEILDSLPTQLWCKKDFYGLDSAQEKIYTWDYFVNQVKYKTRYFFIQDKTTINEHLPYNHPYDILDEFASTIQDYDLIDVLKKREIIYRSRKNDKTKKYIIPEEIGTPKAEDCINPNRMSPAGIPMFYGSSKKDTCLSELKNTSGNYTVGTWQLLRNMRILNLTSIFKFNKELNRYYYPELPSVFDKERREQIFDYQFILKFASDLSGKVEDSVANIDYVPTQIVAEYLRKVALIDGGNLDGICFYSSIDGGVNYALFIEQGECIKPKSWCAYQQKIELVSTEEIDI